MKRFFAVLLILISGCKPASSPVNDLASPSQQIRDAAAKNLRTTAKPPLKIKWFFLTCHIKNGESQPNILALLRSYNLRIQPEAEMGGIGEYVEYRLDDYWLLGCVFNNNDYKNLILERWKLVPRWQEFFIWPPTNFGGVWITYYANGEKFTEDHFKNGQRSGECVTYDPNGYRSSVWNYENGKANGLWTQYFPSGQIEIQCLYSNYLRIGDMVWYYTNGSKRIFEHYDDGQRNGPMSIYFPSGKIESQRQYSNNVKVGPEVHFNEDGTTNRVD